MLFPKKLKFVGRHKYVLISLLLYWPALFAATHIPVPEVVRSAGMSDKKLHFLAYLILVSLLWFVASPHDRVNWKKAKVWIVLAVIVWYGAFDEWLQGFVHRGRDIGDFWADLSGAMTGLVILSIFSFWPGLLVLLGTVIFFVTNLTRVHVILESEYVNTAFNFLAYAAFTLVWIQNIHLYIGLRQAGIKWWIASGSVPLLFLAIVRLYTLTMTDKGIWPYDIATSAAAILSVLAVSYLICRPDKKEV
jgi:VanZ family protein